MTTPEVSNVVEGLQEEITRLQPVHARIEQARSELATLEQRIESQPLDSKAREHERETTQKRRLWLIENITSLEDGAKDQKVVLADAIRRAARLAIGFLTAAKTPDARPAAQSVIDGLRQLDDPYAADHPVRTLLDRAARVAAILTEAGNDLQFP